MNEIEEKPEEDEEYESLFNDDHKPVEMNLVESVPK